jgi:hypothetical protein
MQIMSCFTASDLDGRVCATPSSIIAQRAAGSVWLTADAIRVDDTLAEFGKVTSVYNRQEATCVYVFDSQVAGIPERDVAKWRQRFRLPLTPCLLTCVVPFNTEPALEPEPTSRPAPRTEL